MELYTVQRYKHDSNMVFTPATLTKEELKAMLAELKLEGYKMTVKEGVTTLTEPQWGCDEFTITPMKGGENVKGQDILQAYNRPHSMRRYCKQPKLNWTISVLSHDKKTNSTYYKEINLKYKSEVMLKNIAYIITANHNQPIYDKTKTGIMWDTKQVINKFYTLPHAQQQQVIRKYLEQAYTNYNMYLEELKEKQLEEDAKRLREHNDNTIIIAKLKNITDEEVEHIKQQLIELERVYDLQLDTDYNDKHAVLISYQQVLAYKYYDIKISRKPDVELVTVGDESLLDAMAR